MNLKIISVLLVIILLAVAYRVGYPYYRQHQADALYNQAESTYQQEKYDEALAKYVKLTDNYLQYLSPLKQANIYIAMANCYYDKDKFTDGVDCFAKAAEIVKKHNLLSEIEAPTNFYIRWGQGYEAKKKYFKAKAIYLQSIYTIESVYGRNYLGIALIEARLGIICLRTNSYKDSLMYFNRTFNNKNFWNAQDDLSKAFFLGKWAEAYFHNNKLKEAEKKYKQCLYIMQKCLGAKSSKLGIEYVGLALVLYKQNKINEAIALLDISYEIMKNKHGINYQATQRIARLRKKWKRKRNNK